MVTHKQIFKAEKLISGDYAVVAILHGYSILLPIIGNLTEQQAKDLANILQNSVTDFFS